MTAKRYFNTSGPNNPAEHYTLFRPELVSKGQDMVSKNRYFTIWAPRQTGKSTYFRLLARELEKDGYKVCHINFENYKNASLKSFLSTFIYNINQAWKIDIIKTELSEIFQQLMTISDKKLVLLL